MRRALTLHPDSVCTAASGVEVEVDRPGPRVLVLRYRVSGAVDGLRLPPPAPPERADGLWRHTCLEAFVRAPEGEAYYEFNFAPSTRWAAYRFAGRRSGMTAADVGPPGIKALRNEDGLVLEAVLTLDPLSDLPGDGPWRLGLSAVIEEASGRLSYWALAHPPGKPDFHHPDCFALEVRAPQDI